MASLTAPASTTRRTTRFRAPAPLSRRARRATSGRNLRTAAKNDEGEDNPLFVAFKKYKEANPDEFGGGSTTKVATEKKKKDDGDNKGLDLRSIKSAGSEIRLPKVGYKIAKSEKENYNPDLLFGASAPGLARNVEVFTEWRATYKALKDFGLESVGAKDAAARVDAKTAVIVDVRTGYFYQKEHIEGSLSLPVYTKVKGNLRKKVFLGSRTTERNPDFASEAKTLLGAETRTIVLACTAGGTLKTEVERRDGKRDAYVDSQRAFGRDSLSLRAAKDLLDAGITNVAHLEGGIAAWKAAGLPVEGSGVKASAIDGLPWLGTGPQFYGSDEADEDPVFEEKPSIFGIAYNTAKIPTWSATHTFLSDLGLKSVQPDAALRLSKSKKAVIVDVSTRADFEADHPEGAVNVPLCAEITEERRRNFGKVRNFVTGRRGAPVERDADFGASARALVPNLDQTVVVTCGRGGSLETGVPCKDGQVFMDPSLRFGRESASLRACYDLVQAGYTDVRHMEGGKNTWKDQGLPMGGRYKQQMVFENPGAFVLAGLALNYFSFLLAN